MTHCTLLPGLLGAALQGLLFLGVCVALLWKKTFDVPPRSWPVFLADSSKQIVGAGWLHALNMLCSWGLERHVRSGDACDWYFVNVVVDCTLGVALECLLLRAWSDFIARFGTLQLSAALQSGNYYEPVGYGEDARFQAASYAKQLALWLFVVTQMKALILLLFLAARGFFLEAADAVLGAIPSAEAKLVVVMVAVPFAMNVLQVCLVDSFLKRAA